MIKLLGNLLELGLKIWGVFTSPWKKRSDNAKAIRDHDKSAVNKRLDDGVQ